MTTAAEPDRCDVVAALRALPKAELHLHVEGSIRPRTVVELASRHGVELTEQEARQRFRYSDFLGFLAAFNWVAGFLREPADYALITRRLADELLAQGVVYAEVITAVGVMLWQGQEAEANFAAMAETAQSYEAKGLTIRWLPDAAWQLGAGAAFEVARRVVRWTGMGVIGFGMGGDELMYDYREFRPAFELAAEHGLHRTAHAGEVGPPAKVRDAVEVLGAERIGHGIATMHDPALAELLIERGIPLEICPTSNLRTGALARQLGARRRRSPSTRSRTCSLRACRPRSPPTTRRCSTPTWCPSTPTASMCSVSPSPPHCTSPRPASGTRSCRRAPGRPTWTAFATRRRATLRKPETESE